MFEKIVIGFDGTTQGQDAIALGEMLADERTEILVACAHPLQVVSARVGPSGEYGPRADAESRLQAARAQLGDRPATDFITVAASSAAAGLHELAEAEDADLIVVGSSHRGRVGRVLLGTTAAQTLHAAPCAVAVAPFGLHARAESSLARIGIGFDGGDEARHALKAAHGLAVEHGATLHVISIVEASTWAVGLTGGIVWPEYRDDAIAAAGERLDDALAELADGVPVERQVVDGMPAQELAVASAGLDLLVLGSRGYGPVRRVLLGSVASKVASGTACPLLVYPRGAG